MIIGPLSIGHCREVQVRWIFSDDSADIIFAAELPGAVFLGGIYLSGTFLPHLHIIYAGIYTGLVDGFDKIVGEVGIIYKTAISDSTVKDLYVGTIGEPGAFLFNLT
jgi:hypothetical protein